MGNNEMNNAVENPEVVEMPAAAEPKRAKKVKAPKAPKAAKAGAPEVNRAGNLEFAAHKNGWRYAEGKNGKFAVGNPKRQGAEFTLEIKLAGEKKFILLAKFDNLEAALAEAERRNNE